MNKQELQATMESVRSYVQAIGRLTFRIMPRGWKKVYVGYFLSSDEMEEDLLVKVVVTGVKGYAAPMAFTKKGDSAEQILKQVKEKMRELHDRCEEIDDIWHGCALKMTIHGDYNIFFNYEPMDKASEDWIKRVERVERVPGA